MYENLVYIVVPVYNVEAFLPRCVDSLLSQTYSNIRIILIDDGAKDSSGAICDQYAKEDNRVHVIHKPNGGLSDARNTGIQYCMADSKDHNRDYLALVDSDDFVHPDFVARLLTICEENGCDGAQCRYEHGSEDAFTLERAPNLQITDGRGALLGYRIKTLCPTKMYRLKIYEDESFRVGVLNEDEFISYRLVYKCRRFALTDEMLYYYYRRPGSIMWQMQNKMRDNPHRYDWRKAFIEREEYFKALGDKQLVQRTLEKTCIELLLRYTEQNALPKEDRDRDVISGQYIRDYRNTYKHMISLKTMPLLRKVIYTVFYICPMSAVLVSRFHPLRG